MRVKKIINWLLIFMTSSTLICGIYFIFLLKDIHQTAIELNPKIVESAIIANTALSPIGSPLIVVFFVMLLAANIVKEFHISSLKHRIWSNLSIYLLIVTAMSMFTMTLFKHV